MKKSLLTWLFLLVVAYCGGQTASFSYSQPSKCVPSTVAFTNTSTPGYTAISWDWGDPFDPNPPYTGMEIPTYHPFTQPGKYTVTLTIIYPTGIKVYQQTIDVYPVPVFSFRKLNDSICPGESISFTHSLTIPSSLIGVRSYLWDFGDGFTGSTANPIHSYANPMRYNISLIITDTNGCATRVDSNNYVYVKNKPVAQFAGDSVLCFTPAQTTAIVSFTNTTTGAANYQWDFGDGGSSNQENPQHTFAYRTTPYTVTLVATNAGGCADTVTKTIRPIQYVAAFTVSDTILCDVPSSDVTFAGGDGASSYIWSFGNGSNGYSTGTSAIRHAYALQGHYQVRVEAINRNGCRAVDSLMIYAYSKNNPKNGVELEAVERIMCDISDSVLFINNTSYHLFNNFGFGSVRWIFDDGILIMKRDSASRTFSSYGTHYFRAVVTTPYGCVLDTSAIDSIQIIRTRFAGGVDTKEGCIPLSTNFSFSLPFSSSPITHMMLYWDYYGDKSDTADLFNNPNPNHVYTDTGHFQLVVITTNAQGCTDTFFIDYVEAGISPSGYFTFSYEEKCYGQIKDKVFFVTAHDSINSHAANSWKYYTNHENPPPTTFNPIGISPIDTGYCFFTLIPRHNGCEALYPVTDSIFYACPPIADRDITSPNVSPSHFTFCDFPVEIYGKDSSIGEQWVRWWFGDAPTWSQQTTTMDANVHFTYLKTNPFVYANSYQPGITITFAAYNADSVDIYSPTYNRCKYCADTVVRTIYISDVTPNFGVDKYEICYGDSIRFYDSSTTNTGLFGGWSLTGVNAAFTDTNAEYMYDVVAGTAASYSPSGINGNITLPFAKQNLYTFRFGNICLLGCQHYENVNVNIYSGGVPRYASGKDNIHFNFDPDTLCLNNPDTLYLRDSSYMAYPFENILINQWKWIVFGDTFTQKNPVVVAKQRNLQPITLSIVNEKGCESSTVFHNMLVNEIEAHFSTDDTMYCNETEIEFTNQTIILPLMENRNAGITCIWDWGDSSPKEIQHILNGESPFPTMKHTYNLTNPTNRITVTLTVSMDDMNCTDVFQKTLTISSPIAGFTDDGHYFPCPSNIGRAINFMDTSQGMVRYYSWNFGDTASGTANEIVRDTLSNPIHIYSRAGYYDVSLIVEDITGCTDTLVKPQYVFIDGPMGDFSYSPLSGCVPLEVTFVPSVENTDTIIVNPNMAIAIQRGGAYVDSSIIYTYNQAGTHLPYFYLVKWTYDSVNHVKERCEVSWVGKDTIYPIDIETDFKNDTLYCLDVPVVFQNISIVKPNTLSADSLFWDFGNGETSSYFIDTVKYDSAGIYNITMTIYVKDCSKTITHLIEVMPFPELAFYPDSVEGCGGLEIHFTTDTLTDLEKSRIARYDWTFSDGEKHTGNPIVRSFTQTDLYTYNVLLTFTPENCTKLYSDSIDVIVHIVPTAEFEPTPSTVRMGESIQFIDKSQQGDGDIISWHWNLGDETQTQEQSPTYTYTTVSGYITVDLVIIDTNGCTDSVAHQVLILENLRFPNIFTPQSIRPDGKSYIFRPIADEGFFSEFRIEIYNRHGMKIWSQSCNDPNCPDYQSDSFWWNGKTKAGVPVADGVYYWTVYAIPLSQTKTFIMNGSVTVINH